MNKYMFSDKYLPKDIKSYTGFSHQSALRYIENVLNGKEKKRAIIFHGLPGTGKSTLAMMLPEHFGLSFSYSNASDERKKSQINTDLFRTTSLKSKKSLIILDEMDGLSKPAFRELERVMKRYDQPIILIANDLNKIPYSIRKLSHVEKFGVDRFTLLALANRIVKAEGLDITRGDIKKIVDKSKSYRDILNALQFGIGTNLPEQRSTEEQVLANLSGESTPISTTDLSGMIIRFNDNATAPNLISLADMWNRRYINGYTYGKHIIHAILKSICNPGIKKLNYPRTYALIHQAKTGKKLEVGTTSEKKSKAPKIRIVGFK